MANTQLSKIRHWHEQIVDLMLARPEWTQGQIASYFDKTEAWLSQVINSDLFQAYYHGRMKEHQERVSEGIIDKVEGLAAVSLDKLHNRVASLEDDFNIGPVRETCEMALKSLGYGGRQGGNGSPVQVNIGIASRSLLEEARQEMRQKQQAYQPPQVESRVEDRAMEVTVYGEEEILADR